MFALRYEYGNDKVNGTWNNIGGFQMESIIKGGSPFSMPEPMFKSPRNLRRMLTQKVKRDWNQQYAPGRAALASAAVSGSLCRTVAAPIDSVQPNSFEAVSVDNLTDNLWVTVTFTYINTGSPSLGNITVAGDKNQGVNTKGFFTYENDGLLHPNQTLKLCGGQQSDLKIKDQRVVNIIIFATSNDVDITGVSVCFNQDVDCR